MIWTFPIGGQPTVVAIIISGVIVAVPFGPSETLILLLQIKPPEHWAFTSCKNIKKNSVKTAIIQAKFAKIEVSDFCCEIVVRFMRTKV
jgi:hypothetical protein